MNCELITFLELHQTDALQQYSHIFASSSYSLQPGHSIKTAMIKLNMPTVISMMVKMYATLQRYHLGSKYLRIISCCPA